MSIWNILLKVIGKDLYQGNSLNEKWYKIMCEFSEISNHKRKNPERYVRKILIKDTNDYHFKKLILTWVAVGDFILEKRIYIYCKQEHLCVMSDIWM